MDKILFFDTEIQPESGKILDIVQNATNKAAAMEAIRNMPSGE